MLIKQSIKNIQISDFDYFLPKKNIALHPIKNRDESKLLYIAAKENKMDHFKFYEIEKLLPENSLLVLNSTKVISARLNFQKPTGGKIEILCVDPITPSNDPQITLMAKYTCSWICIIGGRNVKDGMILTAKNQSIDLKAKIIKRFENKAEVEFSWEPPEKSFSKIIESVGKIPLPPYINREVECDDSERYQTVYADIEGSIAAPTAGLHFTKDVFNKLKNKNIQNCELILHVGPGTFQPVEVENVINHNMHYEQIFVTKSTILQLIGFLKNRDIDAKLIATGTTSLRTLETIYWIGVKIIKKLANEQILTLKMMEPYEIENEEIDFLQSLESIFQWMEKLSLDYFNAQTQLFIMPGYQINTAEILITNFHLPKSTLLLLVSAFVGSDFWKSAYNQAIENEYRFLSYGDSSVIFRE